MIGNNQTAVAAGGPLAEAVFIDDGDRPPIFQKVISRESTDDAAANDDGMLTHLNMLFGFQDCGAAIRPGLPR